MEAPTDSAGSHLGQCDIVQQKVGHAFFQQRLVRGVHEKKISVNDLVDFIQILEAIKHCSGPDTAMVLELGSQEKRHWNQISSFSSLDGRMLEIRIVLVRCILINKMFELYPIDPLVMWHSMLIITLFDKCIEFFEFACDCACEDVVEDFIQHISYSMAAGTNVHTMHRVIHKAVVSETFDVQQPMAGQRRPGQLFGCEHVMSPKSARADIRERHGVFVAFASHAWVVFA